MQDILGSPPFKEIKKDQTERNEKKVNDLLKRLAKSDVQNANVFKRLQVSQDGTRPAMLYGSVKIHKDGYPLRPIVSTIGTATYDIAWYVSKILTPYVNSMPSYLKNTAHFLEKLKEIKIEDDEVMISFDIKSLFTNVPIGPSIAEIHKLLQNDTDLHKRTPLKIDSIMSLVHICLTITSFQFRGKHYELMDGLPMGSPVSPCVANIFIAHLEQKALKDFPCPPKIWLRFVDDIFSIIKKDVVASFLAHLNKQHEAITFTVEKEENRELPFMDTKVHRTGNQLATTVYRKPTHTGRYLDYASHHPGSSKKAVVHALAKRIDYVTIAGQKQEEEEK